MAGIVARRRTAGEPSFEIPFLAPLAKTVPKRFRKRMVESFFVIGPAHDAALVLGSQSEYRRWKRRHQEGDFIPASIDVASHSFATQLTRAEMLWVARMLNAARAGVLDMSFTKMYERSKRTKQAFICMVAPDGLQGMVPISVELLTSVGVEALAVELARMLTDSADETRKAHKR